MSPCPAVVQFQGPGGPHSQTGERAEVPGPSGQRVPLRDKKGVPGLPKGLHAPSCVPHPLALDAPRSEPGNEPASGGRPARSPASLRESVNISSLPH